MSRLHPEKHSVERIGWLRAAVLGANDGIVSTSSLIVGVAAAAAGQNEVLVAGSAGLVAGALAMAAGEYVSVSSQADTEAANLERERRELDDHPELELAELSESFVIRGVDRDLAVKVAEQLTAKDVVAAHAREELGISDLTTARPLQAAVTSAAMFAIGAALPLGVVVMSPFRYAPITVPVSSILFLAVLGALGAAVGGAPAWKGIVRVTFWGAIAMAVTAGVGRLFGAPV